MHPCNQNPEGLGTRGPGSILCHRPGFVDKLGKAGPLIILGLSGDRGEAVNKIEGHFHLRPQPLVPLNQSDDYTSSNAQSPFIHPEVLADA